MNITVDEHPLLDAVLLLVRWPAELSGLDTLPSLSTWFSDDVMPTFVPPVLER